MGKGRMEAFSDGVIAVIITVMVLEMKVPHGEDLAAFWAQWLSQILYVAVALIWLVPDKRIENALRNKEAS
jgi:uncharacterized membrane protein